MTYVQTSQEIKANRVQGLWRPHYLTTTQIDLMLPYEMTVFLYYAGSWNAPSGRNPGQCVIQSRKK